MFYNFEKLTDDEIIEKIDLINKKLNFAYGTSINEEYITTLQNSLDQLYAIQDERAFVENVPSGKNKSGIVMETDPVLSNNEHIIVKKDKETPKETTPKKEFTRPEIKKVYKQQKDY